MSLGHTLPDTSGFLEEPAVGWDWYPGCFRIEELHKGEGQLAQTFLKNNNTNNNSKVKTIPWVWLELDGF